MQRVLGRQPGRSLIIIVFIISTIAVG